MSVARIGTLSRRNNHEMSYSWATKAQSVAAQARKPAQAQRPKRNGPGATAQAGALPTRGRADAFLDLAGAACLDGAGFLARDFLAFTGAAFWTEAFLAFVGAACLAGALLALAGAAFLDDAGFLGWAFL